MRRHAASITIATVWSGRMETLKKTWLVALCDSLVAAGKTADLLILDDSNSGFTRPRLTKAQNAVLTGISIKRVHRGISTAQRRPNRRATAEFLCTQCNDILISAQGDVIWFIEDDIVVPSNAAVELLQQLLQRLQSDMSSRVYCPACRRTTQHTTPHTQMKTRPRCRVCVPRRRTQPSIRQVQRTCAAPQPTLPSPLAARVPSPARSTAPQPPY